MLYVRPLILTVIVIVLTKQFLRKWSKQNQETVAIIRIMINMYQIISIMSI